MNRSMRRFEAKNNRRKHPVSIEEMRRKINQAKASGWKPEDAPVRIVPADISASLVDRTAIVGEILTDYLSAINDSGKLSPFSAELFTRHIADLRLLEQSQVTGLRLYGGLIRMSAELACDKDAEYYPTLTKLHEWIGMAAAFYKSDDSQRAKPFTGTDEELDAEIAKYRALVAQKENRK